MKVKISNITIVSICMACVLTTFSALADSTDDHVKCIDQTREQQISFFEDNLKKNLSQTDKANTYYALYLVYNDAKFSGIDNLLQKLDPNYSICGHNFNDKQIDIFLIIGTANAKNYLDKRKAMAYLDQADVLSNPNAKAQMAENLIMGKDVPKNIKLALEKAVTSARQGSALGQLLAGAIYGNLDWYTRDSKASTSGVPIDLVSSYMWLNIAAASGAATASEARDEVAKRMSSSDVSKAQQLATKCLQSKFTSCENSWW